MTKQKASGLFAAATLVAVLLVTGRANAEMSEEELAKISQNPIGNLISLPFQENLYFHTGPLGGTQSVLNIQPVIPVSVNNDWNVLTRTILPIVSQPEFVPGQGRTNGLGDVQFSAFLSPANPGGWIWGVGAIAQLPTHSDPLLGNNNAGLGPTFVVLHLSKGDPWVYGVLVNNVWSLGTSSSAPAYSNGLIQPFVNYNLPEGLYLTSSPIMSVNWKADVSQRWTVPVGGGVGKIFHLGRLPVNTQLSAYYNAVRPDFAPNWQLRAQVQLLFPK